MEMVVVGGSGGGGSRGESHSAFRYEWDVREDDGDSESVVEA